MKFLKNKAKKTLIAAVTMSLVMGVSGSAMANNDTYYGQSDKRSFFMDKPDPAVTTDFNGRWDGLDSSAYGVIIRGGYASVDVKVSSNTVTVTGGNSIFEVSGGFSLFGLAEGNTVNLISGTFVDNAGICGGWGLKGANNNTVCIGCYFKDGKVYFLKGTIVAPKLTVYGGYVRDGTSSGNTVKVMSVGNKIKALNMKSIQNLEFYIPETAEAGQTMLTVNSDVDLEDVTVKAGVDGNNKNLKVNDTVNLIVADEAKITNFDSAKSGILDVDGFGTFGLIIEQQGDNVLQAKIAEEPKEAEPKPDPVNHDAAKSPVETRAAVATILNTGADMLATAGFDNAASAVASEVSAGGVASSMTPFMAMGGTKAKVKSGSHVDVKSWNMNLGLAKEINNKAGKLLIGPVVEYGRGSYDSYVNDVHGEGDSHFWGAGLMAKQTNDNGFYYESSLRAGKASSDYQNKAVAGHSYDTDAAYWAAHVGLGKIVKLGEKDNLDCYGKFFYSHQKGDDVTTKSGTDFHFDATKSVRTRLGMRLNHEMDAKNAIYAGLAWQREFDGDATATVTLLGNNYSTPAPSIKGNTGIMELGWNVSANKNLDLDLGATGYTGKQKGASLNLALNFKF